MQPQQQQQAAQQTRIQVTQSQRGQFPWIRLLIALGIVILLALLFSLSVLSTGHVVAFVWVILAPALIGWIVATFPILQYFFPLNPVTWKPGQRPSQTPDLQTLSVSDSANVAQQQGSSASGSVQHLLVIPAAHIFHSNEPQLPDPNEFYGRGFERDELIHRTSIRASTAIDGEYRIGKSWFMQYLQQVAPTHQRLGSHVRVGKFSATHPQCQTPAGFVKRALEVLNAPNQDVHPKMISLERLAVTAKDFKNLGIIPVLCIDEFAGLIGKPGFDKVFLSGLRSVAEDEELVLITASRQPLHEVIEQITGQTSPLFNIMPRLALRPFTELEAQTFIDKKGLQASFDQQERAFFLECAAIYALDQIIGWPPLRLQLVGKMLLDDKNVAIGQNRAYSANEASYQAYFRQRLDIQYQAMVKHP